MTMRKQRIATTCPWCGEVTFRLPCHANQQFCNRICSNRYSWANKRERKTLTVVEPKATSRVWLKCSRSECGADYWRYWNRADKSRYCSKQCKGLDGAARRAAKEMSPEEYAHRLAAQGGVCAICSRTDERLSLARDHCHRTGAWRGLLCGRCNKGLGLFNDSPELLMAAADYVKRGGVTIVHPATG